MIDYDKLVWIEDKIETETDNDSNMVERLGIYQIPPYAVYLHIDLDTHDVINIAFDFHEEPGLMEDKSIPTSNVDDIMDWLNEMGVVYDEL